MPQRWRSIALSLLSASLFFTACKKQSSSDTPLPTNYYPSVIINSDNQVVYAFDPSTGNKNWEFGMYNPTNYGSISPTNLPTIYFTPSPVLYNGMVYVAYVQRAGATDTIFKINSKTGALVAKILPNKSEVFNIQATPVADGGLLYVAADNGHVFAIDTGTYALKWEFTANSSPIVSSPTIYNGNLYFATTGGTIYCIDKTLGPAGTANWSYAPEVQGDTAFYKNNYNPALDSSLLPSLRGNTNTLATFYSSPVIAPPYLYIGSVNDSNMYCLYLTPAGSPTPPIGQERWRYKTLGGIFSSPVGYAGTCIFGGSDFRVYCLDTTIDPMMKVIVPPKRWIDSVHSSVYSSPYVVNQVVYIGSHDYNLYALNIINGGIKWSFASKGIIKSSPICYNGVLYVGSYDKYLYAVDTATGTLKWSKNTNGLIEDSPVVDDLSGNSYNSGISGFYNGGYTINATNQ
jgi:outer membrane protein assembly factor BamB